ncbi:MAG TPA: hypothetical protein VD997_15465 [Phycisphaerales bacterium]|nr:hypothetical protein [Phycisphaerales bacterium]
MGVTLGPFSLERALNAVAKVRERLFRATGALKAANVPYAVVGGNAVMLWVSRVDETSVRNTQDVDLVIRRESLDAARAALESVGFVYRHADGLDLFLDGTEGKPREAIHIIFANEKVRDHEPVANPDLSESLDAPEGYRVLMLEALVRIKLTAFRDKDRVHLRDLAKVGLIDQSWPAKYPAELADRLQLILDTPNG